MEKKDIYKEAKNVLFGNRENFLPEEKLGPKTMAVLFFSFIVAAIGVGVVFFGSSQGSESAKFVGGIIAVLGIFVFCMAFIYRVFWTIKYLFAKIFK